MKHTVDGYKGPERECFLDGVQTYGVVIADDELGYVEVHTRSPLRPEWVQNPRVKEGVARLIKVKGFAREIPCVRLTGKVVIKAKAIGQPSAQVGSLNDLGKIQEEDKEC